MATDQELFEGCPGLETGRIEHDVTADRTHLAQRRDRLSVDENVETARVAGSQAQSRLLGNGVGFAGAQRARHHRGAVCALNLHPTVLARTQEDAAWRYRRLWRGSRHGARLRRRGCRILLNR